MDYPVETFTDEERAAPRPPLHEPRPARLRAREPAGDGEGRAVRALLALPGHAAAAVPRRVRGERGGARREPFDGEEGERARKLYERIFLGYGDDSVAQLGGAHIACEWVSNVMTKLLQRGRLAAYLEQSTRYMPYDVPIGDGLGYRYWRHPELGPEYEAAMDFLFDVLLARRCRAWRRGRPSASRARTTSRRRRTPARSARRRSTCCAGCCPRPRSRTSGSSPPARPTSSCCCACSPRRCPRRATTRA